MYKIIASDMDGTLLQNGIRVLREDLIPLIKEYAGRGGIFLPATGRQLPNLRMMFRGVEDDISYIAENGCLVVHKGEVIHREEMDRETGLRVCEGILSIAGAKLAISGVNCTYIPKSQPDFFDHVKDYVKTNAVFVDKPEDVPEAFSKISAYSAQGVELFEKKLKDMFGSELNVVTSGLCWTDIMPKGVHKGSALKVFCQKVGVPLSQVVALGDHYNDLEMLQMAGHPACVDNAMPEIKAICERQMECGADLLAYYLTA